MAPAKLACVTAGLGCALLLGGRPACAQSLPDTVSVGFVSLQTNTPQSAALRRFYSGLKIGATLRLRGRWSLDGEADFFSTPVSGGLQETLVGVRYQVAARRRWAFYLAARPGWLYVSGFGEAFFPIGPEFNFVLDLGASAELTLSRRWLWRVQGGDLVIRDPSTFFPAGNLELSTGVAYRF